MNIGRINVVGAMLPFPLEKVGIPGLNSRAWRAEVAAPPLVLTKELEESETKELFRFTPTKQEMSSLKSHRDKFPMKGRFIELHADLCQKYEKQLYSCFSTEIQGDEVVVFALLP